VLLWVGFALQLYLPVGVEQALRVEVVAEQATLAASVCCCTTHMCLQTVLSISPGEWCQCINSTAQVLGIDL
jgi:hypothetical protein